MNVMTVLRRASAVVMLLAVPGLAHAQDTEATVKTKALLTKAPDPTVTNGIMTPDAKFTFSAGPSGKEAKVQIGLQTGALTTSLSFKGKLDDKGDTDLLGLSGLGAGASGAVGLTYARWNPKRDETRARAVCQAFAERTLMKARLLNSAAQMPLTSNCSLAAMTSEPDLQAEQALAVQWTLPLVLSAKYEMGRSSFEFVDAKTGADQPAAIRTPIGASGTIGTIFENGTAVAFTVERSRSYRAGKSAQLCTDLSAGIKTCSDTVLGGPTTSDATVASITLQKSGKNLGVQPRLAYRWTSSTRTTSVDVPIYVLQNKDGGLNGGVSLGWRTKDGARAVLFVGVMTDLFGRK